MIRKDINFRYYLKLLQFSQIPNFIQVKNIITNIERHGRFAQLIKSSKKKRSNREDKTNNKKIEQDYINCIEQQEEDIENLKEELKD